MASRFGHTGIHKKEPTIKHCAAWRQSLLLGALLLGITPITYAELPLDDGARGMTCDFHFAATRADWINRGGDWLDAVGASQGETPFASTVIGTSPSTQSVEWDLSELVSQWNSGITLPAAVMLVQLPGSRNGVVDFRSREYSDPTEHPSLTIVWDNGERQKLQVLADSMINCTTTKSLGGRANLKVSAHEKVALVFPFKPRPGKAVKSASLQLHAYKQWQGGTTVAVHQLYPPWSIPSKQKQGLAERYPNDQGIAADSNVLFATGFEKKDWQRQWSTFNSKSNTYIVDAARNNLFAQLEGKALEVTLIPGQNLGLDLRYDFAKFHEDEPEEIYFRYYLRFGDDWNPTRDGGKLPGFGGTYNRGGWGLRKANGENGWTIRGAFFQQPAGCASMRGYAGIGSYVYHMDVPNAPSENWGWGLGPGGRLEKNKWYSVEQFVKLNSPNQGNGVFKAWINGHLVEEQTGLRFRTNPQIKIENIWLNVYHGGVAKPPHKMSLYIDNVVIASRYIGPMSID